jgi:mannose-1-phosphate guanylyltransferase/mannose-6-phosphate isomerase
MSAKSPTLSKITPVLLCGGSGTRLWPLSRKSYPKQFTALTQEKTLFQATAQRFQGDDFAAPMVLTQSDFRFIVTEQLAAVGVDPGAVVIEPSSRNTGPAILAAALHLHNQDPEALMLVAPSDHVITDEVAFQAAVAAGAKAARAGSMVTFGIEPTRPETGFGYLHLSHVPKADDLTPVPLTSFVEKPNLERAQEMADAGDYLWNAGIFLFSTASIIAAFKAHAPNLMDPVQAAVDNGQPDLGFLRLAPDAWDQAEDISIDFAVMERSDNLMVVPFRAGWSDLGDWDAIWRESTSDATGVVTAGHTTAIDCTDTLLRAEMDNQ